ncbi:MAG: caspase family protein, partial [Elusimicrobia bacterium]|nr:caspase family protein [Elusimicrobiota bacterium]
MRVLLFLLPALALSASVASSAPVSAAWTRLDDIPLRVQSAALGMIGDTIYMAGGYRPLPEGGVHEYVELWAFDPRRQKWSRLPDMPGPRYQTASGVIAGKLYVAGGAHLAGEVPDGSDNVFARGLFEYDAMGRSWARRASQPLAGDSQGVVVDGILYTLGGVCRSTLSAYDPARDAWSQKASMPTSRCSPGVVAFGGRIYVMGGHPLSGPPYDIVEVYDPKSDSWSTASRMPSPRTGFAAAVLAGKIHAVGGRVESTRVGAHEVFDPIAGLWYEAAPMLLPRSDSRAAVAGGKLYIFGGDIGGISDSEALAAAEVYDPSRDRLRLARQPQPPPVVAAPPSRPPQAVRQAPLPDESPQRRGEPRPEDFALVIGVEHYRSLPAADFAERDATVFARYAQAVLGVPEENTILLVGERAAKTDLAKYVEEWLPRNVSGDSRVYFFYSGHGAPDPVKGTAHLMPWDGDPAFLQTSAYPLGRLYERLDRLKAREVVVMLDACFSGAGVRSVIASGLRPLVLVKEAVIPKGDKLTVLTAASGDEVAGSLDAQRHGLFTYYLLKGLDGAADPEGRGHVTV